MADKENSNTTPQRNISFALNTSASNLMETDDASPKRRKTSKGYVELDSSEKPKSELYKDLSYVKFKDHMKMDEENSHNISFDDSPQKVKFVETEEEGEKLRAVAMRPDSFLQNYVIDSIASNERKQYLHQCIANLFDEKNESFQDIF